METSKTFKRLGKVLDYEITRKSQRGYLGKIFGAWYTKHTDQLLREMKQIKPRTIKVTNGSEVFYL